MEVTLLGIGIGIVLAFVVWNIISIGIVVTKWITKERRATSNWFVTREEELDLLEYELTTSAFECDSTFDREIDMIKSGLSQGKIEDWERLKTVNSNTFSENVVELTNEYRRLFVWQMPEALV